MAKLIRKQHKRKVLLLTGAPRRKELSWRDEDLVATGQTPYTNAKLPSTDQVPLWRQLSVKQKHLLSGLTQPYYPLYFHGRNLSDEDAEHQTRDCGPPEEAPLSDDIDTDFNETFNNPSVRPSFVSGVDDISVDASFLSLPTAPKPLLDHVKVTSLVNLPSVQYIKALPSRSPMISNIVVIILAISIQEMQIGKGLVKTDMDLVSLTVADETSCPFELSVWLDRVDANRDHQPDMVLRNMVTSLRRFDVVLVRNIALRTFQDQVKASSMRRMTAMDLLYRNDTTNVDHIPPCYNANSKRSTDRTQDRTFDKIMKIQDWKDNFLQEPLQHQERRDDDRFGSSKANEDGHKGNIQLPVDTQ